MKILSILVLLFSLGSCQTAIPLEATVPKKLKVLQIAGGCCHEYSKQMKLLSTAFNKNFNCQVDTFVEGTICFD